MPTVEVFDRERQVTGSLDLPEGIFAVEVKVPLLHHVVTAQLASRREGTASTKTRKEVRGGGKKPYRQKGTGRARMGSTRSPLLRGGGTVFGPHPRSYAVKVNRKETRAALRGALSAKVAGGRLLVVEDLELAEPRTKEFLRVASALGLSNALIVTEGPSKNLERGLRNIPRYKALPVEALNVYDILSHDQLVLTKPAFEKIREVLGR